MRKYVGRYSIKIWFSCVKLNIYYGPPSKILSKCIKCFSLFLLNNINLLNRNFEYVKHSYSDKYDNKLNFMFMFKCIFYKNNVSDWQEDC